MNAFVQDKKSNIDIRIENIAARDFNMIWKAIIDEVDIGSLKKAIEHQEVKAESISGSEIKVALRNGIDSFIDTIPNDCFVNISERERYSTISSAAVGSGAKDFQEIADKRISDDGEYQLYSAITEAASVLCEYMWKRSKAL